MPWGTRTASNAWHSQEHKWERARFARPGAARRLVTFLDRPRKSKISVQANLTDGCRNYNPFVVKAARWSGYAETKILEKEGRPGVAPRIRVVSLRCLPRCGDCATRPEGTLNVSARRGEVVSSRAARRASWGKSKSPGVRHFLSTESCFSNSTQHPSTCRRPPTPSISMEGSCLGGRPVASRLRVSPRH